MQSWVTQRHTWPAHRLHAATAASLAHGDVVITCDGTHHYPCNYDNMRGIAETAGAWSGLLAHHVCASNEQTCGKLPWRTNAVAVGPVSMMCKLTLTLTNANANFFSSPTRSHSERAARRNCMPQLRARSFRARHKTQLHAATAARCKPHLQPTLHMAKW